MLARDYRGADGWRLASLGFVALALVPAGAHLAALPNKIGRAPEAYMIMQQAYAGWALFGIVIFGALLTTAVHTIVMRRQRGPFWLSLGAFLLLAATQFVFWIYTYPANAATSNWTVLPADFEGWRRQWESSHAVNAVLTLAAFILLALAILETRRDDERPQV
ncbi:MAG: DUF1772 domain-containing protein [Hyphomicrobiaceae bacterium]|nr:DUF1772 domain-containing protein [Hyphomicrobiaceae bacterium]